MSKTNVAVARRSDLDWLRVLAIATIFIYHSTRFYNLGDWSVKNAVTYWWVEQFEGILVQFMMPIIFLVSGASLYYAISKGGPGKYVKDKAVRLLIPLVVAAFSHASFQVYVERVSHGQFRGSYFEFIPHYFDGLYFEGGTGNFAFHGMHLWYLLVLFVFCMLLMPVFFWLKGGLGSKALERLGDFLALPGAVVLLAVPTIVLANTVHASALGLTLGGWGLEYYLWFFFSGFLIISHEGVQRRIEQLRWGALAGAVAIIVQSLVAKGDVFAHTDLASWCLIFAILGFAMRRLTFRNPALDYASEAVMPFYVMHQTVLLCVGFFVVQWGIPDLAKYMITTVSSLAIMMLLYEPLVRRNNVLRVLFGMHPTRRDRVGVAAAPTRAML